MFAEGVGFSGDPFQKNGSPLYPSIPVFYKNTGPNTIKDVPFPMASPITLAMKQIAEEKNISYESVLETVEAALANAYRKDFGNKNQNIKVEFDPEKYDGSTGGIRVFDSKQVVENMVLPEDYFSRFDAATAPKKRDDRVTPEAAAVSAEQFAQEFVFNPKTMIMLNDARDLKPDAQIDEEIRVELGIPTAFGRTAAQTAKQVILQRLREAERGVIYNDFKGREGELMNVTVQRREGRVVLIDLGRTTGVLLPEDQIESERYYPGTRIKALLREVALTTKGPEIRLSRSSPQVVAALFAQEIPEIANGVVEIRDIAREAGSRSKLAVTTGDSAIDPIGSCIGQRGVRIQTIIRELGGEKVDIIEWSEDAAKFIEAALAPAKIMSVSLDEAEHLATVLVSPDQLSLAIGKGGQNVRLAARLTGWKITIREDGAPEPAVVEGAVVASDSAEVVEESATQDAPESAAQADAKDAGLAS